MLISRNMLNSFINLNEIEFNDLCEKMVALGNEYENIYPLCNVHGLIIGQITEVSEHPNSDHLHVCQVNTGTNNLQIVCGAPNVDTNQKVIVAPIGTIMPNNMTINEVKLRGITSQGMLCSLAELGLNKTFLTKEDTDGIYILDENAPIGSDVLSYLNLNDLVCNFELTANRGDLLSYLGFAYETKSIINKEVSIPDTTYNPASNSKNFIKLNIETDKCSQFHTMLVKNIKMNKTPAFIKNRLIANNIRSINLLVDISNYCMLEFGNPVHFYDYDKLGADITVRAAYENEKLTTLNKEECTLKESNIVISSNNKAIGLAGVMGGLDTEITENTTNVLIECAVFDSLSIRKTALEFVRSEASTRFEKGIDPNIGILAIKRCANLLERLADGQVNDHIISHTQDTKPHHILIKPQEINNILGLNLSSDEIIKNLRKLSFDILKNDTYLEIIVPSRRLDIEIKADIIEEVGRLIGLDNIKAIPLNLTLKNAPISKQEKFIKQIKAFLINNGLNEVITYALTNENTTYGYALTDYEKVFVLDQLSLDRKTLRQSLIPSLIEVNHYNINHNNNNIFIFEIGKKYYKLNDDFKEEHLVSGLLNGTILNNNWQHTKINIDFYSAKGIINNMLMSLGFSNITYTNDNIPRLFNEFATARICISQQTIGFLGYTKKENLLVFELYLDQMIEHIIPLITHQEASKFPTIKKDVSFFVDSNLNSDEIKSIIQSMDIDCLKEINVFDMYQKDDHTKSLGYSLTFSDSTKTLLDNDVNKIFTDIIHEVTTKTSAILRDK